MPIIPVLKFREIHSVLIKLGFCEIRQSGSHKQYKHIDGRFTTVPFHGNKDIPPLLLRQILKDIDLEVKDFLKEL